MLSKGLLKKVTRLTATSGGWRVLWHAGAQQVIFPILVKPRVQLKTLSQQVPSASNSPSASCALLCHIFYPEYVPKLIQMLKSLDAGSISAALITTPSEEIAAEISSLWTMQEVPVKVILSQNRGRNFGPMLVEAGQELMNFEYVIHVHSKNSPHAPVALASSWASRTWNLFLGEPGSVKKLVGIFSSNKNLGLVYANCYDILGLSAITWGANWKFASKFLNLWSMKSQHVFAYPAGGMFMARTSSISQILEYGWTYEDFPEELGQLDGTMQHAVERLIGVVAQGNGFESAVISESGAVQVVKVHGSFNRSQD